MPLKRHFVFLFTGLRKMPNCVFLSDHHENKEKQFNIGAEVFSIISISTAATMVVACPWVHSNEGLLFERNDNLFH